MGIEAVFTLASSIVGIAKRRAAEGAISKVTPSGSREGSIRILMH